MALVADLKRGKGCTCSYRCAAHLQGPKDQSGERNPNWRGGPITPSRIAKARYRSRHAIKCEAHKKLNRARKSGIVLPQPCKVCGDLNVHGHHTDYSKPLDVTWLCPKHHQQEHVYLRKHGVGLYCQYPVAEKPTGMVAK